MPPTAPADQRAAATVEAAASPPSPARVSVGDLLAPARGPLTVAVVLYVVSALAAIVPFIAVVELTRTLLPLTASLPVDSRRAWAIVWVVIGALLTRAITQTTALVITHLVDARLGAGLRRRIVDHLRVVPLGWFGSHTSGRVKKAAQDDVSAMHHLVAHSLVDITGAIVTPLAILVYLFWVDWRMALVALIPLVAAFGLYAVSMGGSMELYNRYDASLAEINSATVEYAGGIAVIKAFGQTGKAHDRFVEVCLRFARFFNSWMKQASRSGTAVEVAASPPVALGLLTLAAAALMSTGTPFTDVLPGLVLGVGVVAPLMSLAFGFQDMRAATEAAGNIGELLAVPAMREPASPTAPSGSRIDIDNVTFSYDSGTVALREVSLRVEPGTVTALVGASGSGKSSLARLIPRFYDPQTGQVRLGAVPVHQIGSGLLYRQVGFVFQDDYLLHASLRENIALGRPDADDQTIEDAARAAQIHECILALPRGYDTILGEDAELSGGERQRVAIARALLADAPVLVLDEATAFADPDSEASIQEALSELVRDRTLLVIAHRLHTIRHADTIVVLDGGRIVAQGRHDDLLAAGGEYARLWYATRHVTADAIAQVPR